MEDPLAKVHATAAKNGFVDTRLEALPDGLRPRRVRRHLRRIGWSPWARSLWVPDADAASMLVRCRLALAAAGSDAVLTGASALWAYGILRSEPDEVTILVASNRWLRVPEGVRVRYTDDAAALRSISAHGLPCTRAARAIGDHAQRASTTELCRVVAEAIQQRRCTLQHVADELDRRQRFPGCGRLRAVVEQLRGELNHSASERLARRLLRDASVRVPARPGPVILHDRPVAEIDLPFYDVSYGVEIDGPPHLLREQAARDTVRDRMLGRECDWTIERFFWFELEEHPKRFVHAVVARLRALGSAAAPPVPPR